MKRIIMLIMALVIMLVSIGGCWPWRDEGGGHERDEGYDRGAGTGGPRGHAGPGGAGGGH
jgi:hypothetical protein